MARLLTGMLVFGVLYLALLACGCPRNPDAEKTVAQSAQVPGLEEAIIAKDRAIKSTIEASWMADPELTQEQLAVEEVRAGKVRITGIVSKEKLKERAEKIARNMEGVTDVVSTIAVDESLQEQRFDFEM